MVAAAEVATRALPPTAIETTPAMGGMEGIMAEGPSNATAVAEAAAHAMPSTATETTPAMGGTEGIMAEGPSNAVAVVEETGRELSLALTLESHHPPVWDGPPLRWVSPWDPSSKVFTLDDAAKGTEWESLNKRITTALEALNQTRGTL